MLSLSISLALCSVAVSCISVYYSWRTKRAYQVRENLDFFDRPRDDPLEKEVLDIMQKKLYRHLDSSLYNNRLELKRFQRKDNEVVYFNLFQIGGIFTSSLNLATAVCSSDKILHVSTLFDCLDNYLERIR